MPRPILHTFSTSHFSEKAAWGLDWAGIDYELRPNIPFANFLISRRLKVPQTSVPILERPGAPAIQGSAAILDWAQAETGNLPTGAEDVEAYLDAELGKHVAIYFYSEAALKTPAIIPPLFLHGLSRKRALTFRATWPLIRRAMIAGLRLGPERRAKARDRILTALDWLDTRLSDGRPYAAGDTPGRGDITAASLLAPLVQPEGHPVYHHLTLPPDMAADCAEWSDRPSFHLTRRMYRDHRAVPRP